MRKIRWIFLAVGSLLSAWLFVSFFGSTLAVVGPLRVVATAHPASRGVTALRVPPFGEVEARTHATPIRLELSLESLDLSTLGNYIKSPSLQAKVIGDVRGAVGPLVLRFTLKALALGALGGLMVPLVAGRRSLKSLASGGAMGLGAVALAVALTGTSYNQEAFRHPTYRGVLEAAPWMVGFIERSWSQVDKFGDELEALATNLASLSAQAEDLGPLGLPGSELKVLHVSDIHNNPAGVKFIREVVKAFNVDAVIDTGDLTDFGTPVEARFIDGLSGLGVPYYWVPGNHDSPELVQSIRRTTPIKVLDGRPRDFHGLSIIGLPDPSSETGSPEVVDSRIVADGERLAKLVEGLPRTPDIVAVHNPKMGQQLMGRVPVLLAGHTHSLAVRKDGETVYVNAGSSGAAGVRGFQSREDVPYTVALLHFRSQSKASQEAGYLLEAVDTITVSSRSGGFALQRILASPKRNPN